MTQEGKRALDVVLRNARVEGQLELVAIGIAHDRIAMIAPTIGWGGRDEFDCEGRLVSPSFVDPHIHLDKVRTVPLLPENRSGTLREAIELLHRTKRTSSTEEVAARAGEVIRSAVASGTTILRTHVDIDPVGGLVPLQGVLAARQDHADLCAVQIVAFPQEGVVRAPGTEELMKRAMESGADVVGGMPHWEKSPEAARHHIRFCLDLAIANDADVDMHVDETDDPRSRTLEILIEETERRGWGGRVSAGHCCAMAAWEDEYAARVIRRAADVGVNIITNPATNLLLQGRADREPRRRGIPRVKELLAAGVRMGCGQDCVNDAFYPFGAADQLQVALILCHAAQLSTAPEIVQAVRMIREDAAAIIGMADHSIKEGAQADLVVLEATDMAEALRLQVPRRWVFRQGRLVAETRQEQRLIRLEYGSS